VPYRCFYSRNVPNLFMAGRDISVTHVALGTTRLMRTHGMMGEVVGVQEARLRSARRLHDAFRRAQGADGLGVGDGKKHPRQDYNCQFSLDPEIEKKYAESVEGRIE
jgi:hypothetical protein